MKEFGYFYEDKKVSDLEHYGIKGMAWGVKNGPPYPLNSKISKSIKKYSHNEAYSMSNKQLQEKINRYRMEQEYRTLAKKRSHPKIATVENFINKNGDKILSATVAAIGAIYIKRITDKLKT